MGEREERVTYTESEIWKALKAAGHLYASCRIMENLKEVKNDHIHDFTDDDPITVKEVREAWGRLHYKLVTAGGPGPLLRDISEHREPVYPQGSTWRDRAGLIYCRDGRNWLRFGTQVTFADNVPLRPLKRMEIQE